MNFFSLQRKKKEERPPSEQVFGMLPAHLRMQKDFTDLLLPKNASLEFADPNDLLNFKCTICPDEGFYKGGKFVFTFCVGHNYPHAPPKVKCETKIYHPNIDREGNICLNILREDWKPVLNINSVIYGLLHLLLEPNPDDPLEKDIANEMKNNAGLFVVNVQKVMRASNKRPFQPPQYNV